MPLSTIFQSYCVLLVEETGENLCPVARHDLSTFVELLI